MLPVKSNVMPTISRFFDDDWNNLFDWTNRNFTHSNGTLPPVNILNEPDAFHVEVAAPGFHKEDFEVQIENNTLTISVQKNANDEQENISKYSRREFSYGAFQRSFNLNNQVVDNAKIAAKYENGILKLILPKREEAKVKPPRKIKIS